MRFVKNAPYKNLVTHLWSLMQNFAFLSPKCVELNKYDKIQLLPFYKGIQPCKVVFLPFKFYLQLKQMNCALKLGYPNISYSETSFSLTGPLRKRTKFVSHIPSCLHMSLSISQKLTTIIRILADKVIYRGFHTTSVEHGMGIMSEPSVFT